MAKSEDKSRKSPSFDGLAPASAAASRAKQANRKRDSRHELMLRRELWKLGLRYRKYAADLPGNPDLIFRRTRVAIFCDGDFWHGRDWDRLSVALERRHNAQYWIAKIARNRERDHEQTARLEAAGWLVLRFWETDILRDPSAVAAAVLESVRCRLAQRGIAAAKSPPS
jgi:DNA mismatch endonuclease (patch repair protein)